MTPCGESFIPISATISTTMVNDCQESNYPTRRMPLGRQRSTVVANICFIAYDPGGVVNTNSATWPATVGEGMTMAMLHAPCSLPYLHPRATNSVVSISSTTQIIVIHENGAQIITEISTMGKMTIFPQSAIHTMMNMGCENAQPVSALNSGDADTSHLANAFFSLPSNFASTIISSNLSDQSIDGAIPPVGTGSNYGPEQCVAAYKAKGKVIRRDLWMV